MMEILSLKLFGCLSGQRDPYDPCGVKGTIQDCPGLLLSYLVGLMVIYNDDPCVFGLLFLVT